MTERIPELPTDRYLLDWSETCLYMGIFFEFSNRFTITVNQNKQLKKGVQFGMSIYQKLRIDLIRDQYVL